MTVQEIDFAWEVWGAMLAIMLLWERTYASMNEDI